MPLVVADVNAAALEGVGARGLIALPGSASVALATALAPLHALAGLERAEVATYQAVSGSGRAAMDELAGETVAMLSGKRPRGRAFGRQIAFNVIPQVDALEDDGATREERRLWEETRRVLDLPAIGDQRDGGAGAGILRPQPRCACRCSSDRSSAARGRRGAAARQRSQRDRCRLNGRIPDAGHTGDGPG